MNNIFKHFTVALKGAGMGAANVVPGVSGGTIALITGIYGDVVDAINAFTARKTWKALLSGDLRGFWREIKGAFLIALGIGVIVSIFSLAKIMTFVLEFYPIPTWAFFFGLIIASSLLMFKDIQGWGFKEVLFILVGAAAAVAVCLLSPTQTSDDLWFIFICGALAICTMILPGVSGSFVLLILGKYDYIMRALTELNWPVLLVFALGCVVGLLAFAKLLHWLLGSWEKQTMLVLLGFVLGFLIRVWPWSDVDMARKAQLMRTGSIETLDLQIPWAILACVLGVALVLGLDYFGKAHKKSVQQ